MVMTYPLRQEYLIAYDIVENKTRTLVYNELYAYGLNAIQKSLFWGYLTSAEINAISRYFEKYLQQSDKAFITHTNFNGRGQSFFFGHEPTDFQDWDESIVV